LAVGGIAAWNIRTGTPAFLFAFPLVNNWPYFFRMDETTPHVPMALGLLLFYVLGRLVHRGRRRPSALGALLYFRGLLWILSGTFAAAALLIYPFIGVRSGFLDLLAGLLWVGALSVIARFRTRRTAGESPGSAIRRIVLKCLKKDRDGNIENLYTFCLGLF
jgi:hypothetical protein